MQKKDEKQQKKLFSQSYCRLGNLRESAITAGYAPSTAFKRGLELLTDSFVRREIRKSLKMQESVSVRAGLERIAFGSISDVVELVTAEEPISPHRISQMDLYSVSEIKRVKGGGFEVKLFDRQKALEKLFELDNSEGGSERAESFFKALSTSVEDKISFSEENVEVTDDEG